MPQGGAALERKRRQRQHARGDSRVKTVGAMRRSESREGVIGAAGWIRGAESEPDTQRKNPRTRSAPHQPGLPKAGSVAELPPLRLDGSRGVPNGPRKPRKRINDGTGDESGVASPAVEQKGTPVHVGFSGCSRQYKEY